MTPIAASRVIGSILAVFLLAFPALGQAAITDLDGNGRSDLLWHNAASGMVYRMNLTGFSPSGEGVAYTEPNTAWRLVGDGDFNGDGRADLLWRHDVTGAVYVALSGVGGVTAGGGVIHVEPNRAWRIVATEDHDGDGRADVLWWNESTGMVYLMLMNGVAVTAQGVVYVEPNTSWRPVAVGDFGGTGRADRIVWRHDTTGEVYLLSAVRTPTGFTLGGAMIYVEANPAWKIVAAPDLDGDGTSDLLWRNTSTGGVFGMLMNPAGTIRAAGMIHVEGNLAWRIVAAGDYDGDGRSDLLWRNFTTGMVWLMRMNGLAITAQGAVYNEPEQLWRVKGMNDYSDDDRLPPTAATVATGIASLAGTYQVPPSCATNPRINCGGGVPQPTNMLIAFAPATVQPDFHFALAAGASGANIRIDYTDGTFGSITCFANVNTSSGLSATISLGGTGVFASQFGGGTVNRLALQFMAPTGIEDADISYSGNFLCGSVGPLITSSFKPYVAEQIAAGLSRTLCGVAGPELFGKCPP